MYKLIMALIIMTAANTCFANGDVIAYLAREKSYWQVWTMNADGSNQQKVSHTDYDKNRISWYPDGEHILINGNQGELNILDIGTGEETAIKIPIEGTLDAVVSPDGQYIAFSLSVAGSRDNNHIWLVDKNGSNLVKLTSMSGLQHEPAWSTDGKWVYFLSSSSSDAHDIWRVSVSNKKTEQLTVGQLYHFDLAINRNNVLAFSSNRTGEYELWLHEQGKDRQITNNNFLDSRPSWNADGSMVAYESTQSGTINIWRMDIHKKQPIQLTNRKTGARMPVWFATNNIGDM